MKQFLFGILSLGFFVLMSACTPEEAAPQFRVSNERGDKANVQIQTSGGNTININDVQAGQMTVFQSAPEGAVVATAVIQNEPVSPTVTFYAWKDTRTTVTIQSGSTPTLRIDQ
ncbi:MAG TPA: hypothetical protein VGA55_06485 [Bacteroidota bacterium]